MRNQKNLIRSGNIHFKARHSANTTINHLNVAMSTELNRNLISYHLWSTFYCDYNKYMYNCVCVYKNKSVTTKTSMCWKQLTALPFDISGASEKQLEFLASFPFPGDFLQ